MGAPVLYQCCESEFSYDLFRCVVPADEGIRGKGRIVQYHPPVSVLSWPAHVSGENGKRVWLLFFMTGVAAIDLYDVIL